MSFSVGSWLFYCVHSFPKFVKMKMCVIDCLVRVSCNRRLEKDFHFKSFFLKHCMTRHAT